jgi:uncharacterized membrane protein
MQYNIHPLLVHFPIALLFLYSIIKILPLAKWFPNVAWKQVERVLLATGFLGACAALLSGEAAEHLARPNRNLVDMHSVFATLSTWLYGALLVGELLSMLNPIFLAKNVFSQLTKITLWLEKILCHKLFSKFIALVALVAISVTGMLGGVMVYGASADPVAPFVLKILGISL